MNFDTLLIGKILDPIHGTIRITCFEKNVINHRLFQRLRTVKQNTFLYKVFPSAMHSRFEHSLGVMHISYKIYENLVLNSHRYKAKYPDDLLFKHIEKIPNIKIQELRLAALLHDVGHGPMSHQFDSFLMNKNQLIEYIGDEHKDIYDLIDDEDSVTHKHISLLFIKKIISDVYLTDVDLTYFGLTEKINIDNIISLIESNYKKSEILFEFENNSYNILPLFSSLISSSPIDSDRMDYLLRDSYFSGVKCGIYNIERLLMSVIPVVKKNRVCLAFKESSLDSISEFVFSRMNLFSQVYFHKTNRAFSAMLSKACDLIVAKGKSELITKLYNLEKNCERDNLDLLQDFYLDNSDDYFINESVPKLLCDIEVAEGLINGIIDRKPWNKLYEAKFYKSGTIKEGIDKNLVCSIRNELKNILKDTFNSDEYIIDIMTDNAFKDISKTEIQLLVKDYEGNYEAKHISECGDKLNIYQSLRYFIRVFTEPKTNESNWPSIQAELDKVTNTILYKK